MALPNEQNKKKENDEHEKSTMSQLQKDIFQKISANEVEELKSLLSANKVKVDFVDEHGVSPLQHACYKGNQDIAQMLLDQVSIPKIIIS